MNFINLVGKNDLLNFDTIKEGFVNECLDYLKYLETLQDNLNVTEIDEYEVLDYLEEYANLPFPENIGAFQSNVCGFDDNQNRRASYVVENMKKLTSLVEPAVEEYRPLTCDEKSRILYYLDEVIAHLSSLCYYFLGFNILAYDYENGEPKECIYEIFRYAQNKNVELKDLALWIKSLRFKHRSSLSALEEYPEIQDKFYDRIGCGDEDLEELTSVITLDDVMTFLNSDMDSDMFIIDMREKLQNRK